MRKLFLLLTFLSFVLPHLVAQTSVRYYGRVSDESNHGIEAVDVTVDGLPYGTSTDSSGRYSFEFETNLPKLTLRFEQFGYGVMTSVQKVKAGSHRVNVTLRDSSVMLSGVSVSEVSRQTASVSRLPVERLKETPSANGGIEGLITTQAGVSSSNELSSQYNVRGGNYDENSVYVNHIEVYRPMLVRSGEQEGLSFVNPDLVESLSFSTGGYSVEYGDKMSSVLDIQYKKPEAFEGSAMVSLLGASAYVGAKTGKLTQIHGVRYKSNEYLLGSLDTEGEYKPRFFDYQTYITYTFNPKWELSLLGNISRNSYQFVPVDRTTRFGTVAMAKELKVYFEGQEKDLFQTFFGNLALKFCPTKEVELQLLASNYYTRENETYDIYGEYALSDVDGSNSAFVDLSSGIGSYTQHARNWMHAQVTGFSHLGKFKRGANEFKWGATYQREKISEKVSEWEMRDSSGFSMPFNADCLNLYYNLFSDNEVESNRIMGYVMDSYTFRPDVGRVVLSGGVRGSYWDWNSEFLMSPRASIAFFPEKMPRWGFRLASGLYYQTPFYKELRDTFTVDGNTEIRLNKDIKSQRSVQLVAGGDYYFHAWQRPFKFTTEIYGKYIDRLISYNVDNVRIIYSGENDGEGYVVGADFKVFGEFVPGTDSWISLSLMKAKENIYGDGCGFISRPSEKRYDVSMFFQDYFPGYEKFKFNLRLLWGDGLPFGPPHSERKDAVFRSSPYRRVDIGCTYVMKRSNSKFMQTKPFSNLKTVSLGLDVLNLFDIRNESSFFWVTDVTNCQYAVPNYLTSRQVNIKLTVDF
ncbi:MAG: TonB-dependent receptor [Paludibacteraceae bacterium]|nr:TonB-dependent receptor [Paludibacteraceae bacterium]